MLFLCLFLSTGVLCSFSREGLCKLIIWLCFADDFFGLKGVFGVVIHVVFSVCSKKLVGVLLGYASSLLCY